MNIPKIKSYEEQAIDTVVSVLNGAKEKLGLRQTLREFAASRDIVASHPKVSLHTITAPLAITTEKLIAETIENKWRLTDTLMYIIQYLGGSQDECSQYYYFEAVFSQPTAAYPVPQTTASVFFRVEDKHLEPPEISGVPRMKFRIEGQHTDHDIRYVTLTVDAILAVMMMKIKLFKRIEALRLF